MLKQHKVWIYSSCGLGCPVSSSPYRKHRSLESVRGDAAARYAHDEGKNDVRGTLFSLCVWHSIFEEVKKL